MSITSTIDSFLAAYGLYLLVCGIATLITGDILGHGKDISVKNTPESVRAAAPLLGTANTVVGLAMLVPELGSWFDALSFLHTYEWYILIGGSAVAVVLVLLGYRKLVEKKEL